MPYRSRIYTSGLQFVQPKHVKMLMFNKTAGRPTRIGRYQASPVVGFVRTSIKPVKRVSTSQLLEEKATQWLESINARRLNDVDELIAADALYHDDGMWLLQPAKGRTAIRKVWRDWLRSVPGYLIDVLHVATEPATSDAFILWRASGMAKLSVIPQRPPTNKPFEHYGVTRLHFDPSTGQITDQWTWRGASTDEAKWLLTRSYKPFNLVSFINSDSSSSTNSDNGSSRRAADTTANAISSLAATGAASENGAAAATAVDSSMAARAQAKGAALLFRESFGAVQGADLRRLDAALSEDYKCQEATGVWRGMNLSSREACLQYCEQRQHELAGSPYWHSEAMTADGKLMFVHFQNVLTNKHSRTLVGLASGVLVHVFDEQQRIKRTLMFRGPMSLSERAEFFNMDCRACGRSQADQLGVTDSVLGGM